MADNATHLDDEMRKLIGGCGLRAFWQFMNEPVDGFNCTSTYQADFDNNICDIPRRCDILQNCDIRIDMPALPQGVAWVDDVADILFDKLNLLYAGKSFASTTLLLL